MIPDAKNSGLTLAMLKNRIEGFSLPQGVGELKEPTPNAQQNDGVISANTPKDSVALSNSNFEILAFAKSAKGANEYIGALQTANIALKKIEKGLTEGADENSMNEIASKSSFMGNKLFDKNLVVSIGHNDFSLTLQNPSSLDAKDRLSYISAKRAEITETLSNVSKAIASPSTTPSVPANGQPYNFEEFDAQMFKKMF